MPKQVYSLAARSLSELSATTIMIFLGNSMNANWHLSKTKGKGMGQPFMAVGFGIGCLIEKVWVLDLQVICLDFAPLI